MGDITATSASNHHAIKVGTKCRMLSKTACFDGSTKKIRCFTLLSKLLNQVVCQFFLCKIDQTDMWVVQFFFCLFVCLFCTRLHDYFFDEPNPEKPMVAAMSGSTSSVGSCAFRFRSLRFSRRYSRSFSSSSRSSCMRCSKS